jgi:hypothetical protein
LWCRSANRSGQMALTLIACAHILCG